MQIQETIFKKKGIINLALLLASRAGGILVTIVFLPLYLNMLGVEQFGIVAVLLSLQAFLVMLDLGMSTIVGRDVAEFGANSIKSRLVLRNSEVLITVFYVGIVSLSIFWVLVIGPIPGLSPLLVCTIGILFWIMVLQNIGLSALLGAKAFMEAGIIQLFGTLFRAILTLYGMKIFGATIFVFVIFQLGTSIIQLTIARYAFLKLPTGDIDNKKVYLKVSFGSCLRLLKRGRSLLIFGLAGASVTQLDKLIIAKFFSAYDVSAYFLALTFCMTPIIILGGPIFQYYQPHFAAEAAKNNKIAAEKTLINFVMAMSLIVIPATAVFWFYSKFWINLWLQNNPANIDIETYVNILMPGIALGAFGFIPYTVLTTFQDYSFQSRLSALMTATTLCAVFILASCGNIIGICVTYVIYHCTSTLSSWIRSIAIPSTRKYGVVSLKIFVKYASFLIISLFLLKIILDYLYPYNEQVYYFITVFYLLLFFSLFFYYKFLSASSNVS